jgi:hypothetical protein
MKGGRNVEEQERDYLTLQAIVDVASRTVLRVNKEPQSPAPNLTEFVTSKRQEGWEFAGIAPCGVQLLMIFKRPLA